MLRKYRPLMKDTVIWNIEQGAKLTGAQVGAAEIKRTRIYHRMREFMQTYDYLVAPVAQVLPFDVHLPFPTCVEGVPFTTYLDWMKSCYLITVTGAPAMSVPCGFSSGGLPVGLQIVGRHRQEFELLQMAFAFEQATGCWKRRPPLA
jgi:amidase